MSKFSGITDDSREVKPGFLFVAVKGLRSDGHDFISEAVKNGAKTVVGERDIKGLPVEYIRVADSREALGKLASEFYGDPSQQLKIIGVTGTKGKTTTCHIIHHILTTLGKKAGLISTISTPGLHVTSLDVVSLNKTLKEFVDKGFEFAVVEVSSHGIDQKRIAGVKFDVGVLTNVAPEHLDYHKTFEEYKKSKMSFINSCVKKVVMPKNTDIDVLPGAYNNFDAECAVQALEQVEIPREDSLKTLETFELPEGRLTSVPNNLGVSIFIDFAHTPDSLEAVMNHLGTRTKGRLISVFGCAGERDKKKRFKMGKISAKLADFSVFTAEDPRSESVFSIMSKMAEGARKAGGIENKDFVRIAERGEAIAYALSIARTGDTVAILGKGHEKSMAYENFEHPWDDARVVKDFLNRDKNVSVVILAAGKGTRMKSNFPKVLHEICGRPMISYTFENLRSAGVGEMITVVSFMRNRVVKEVGGTTKIAIQENPKGGTADAAKTGFEKVKPDAQTLVIINGDDSAFYKSETIKEIIRIHLERERKVTFVSLMKDDPSGLGRVMRGTDGLITKIVEEKDATDSEKKIKEVNDGLYVFDKNWFAENIGKVKKSKSGELYLVDLIKIAIDQKDKMATYTLPDDSQWQGINTQEELQKAQHKMMNRLVSNI